MTGQLEPTLATARVPVAAMTAPTSTPSRSNVWGSVESRMLDDDRRLGELHPTIRRCRPPPRGRRAVRPARRQLLPFADKTKLVSPVTYPQTTDSFPQHLAGLAAMIAAGPADALRRARGERRVRHPRRRGAPRSRPRSRLTAQSLLAFQRDLEARGVADRVLTLVWIGVRAPRPGERLGRHRPRRRRQRVPDRHARRRRDGRRVPGPRPRPRRERQPQADRRTSAASTRRCSSSGSGSTRPGSSRDVDKFARPKLVRA